MVTRLTPHTTAANVAVHVYKETGVTVRPEKMPTKHSNYASYYIRCNAYNRKKLICPENWPRDVLVKPFYDK